MSNLRQPRPLTGSLVGRARQIIPALGPNREPWQQQAACRGIGTDAFFPERNKESGRIRQGQYLEAKRICDQCPVRAECLDFALRENLRGGMYGGLTPRQRRELFRTPAQAAS